MQFQRSPPKSGLNLLHGCIRTHTENYVIILFHSGPPFRAHSGIGQNETTDTPAPRRGREGGRRSRLRLPLRSFGRADSLLAICTLSMPSLNSAFTLSAGRVIRQTEAAIGTLHAVILSALFLLLKFAFAGDDEHAVFDRDFDLFLFD